MRYSSEIIYHERCRRYSARVRIGVRFNLLQCRDRKERISIDESGSGAGKEAMWKDREDLGGSLMALEACS